MKNTSIAIMVKFNALIAGVHNDFYNSVSGKLYKERAPQDAVLPYAVYHIIDNIPDWTFTSYFEDARIQFDLYSSDNSSSEVEDMYTYLKQLFDWCQLSITSNTFLYMRRESARLTRDPSDDVWTYSVDYLIKMESTSSESPSMSPSASPSESPSASPSMSPSASPSASPSNSPSLSPSASASPSESPSPSPSEAP